MGRQLHDEKSAHGHAMPPRLIRQERAATKARGQQSLQPNTPAPPALWPPASRHPPGLDTHPSRRAGSTASVSGFTSRSDLARQAGLHQRYMLTPSICILDYGRSNSRFKGGKPSPPPPPPHPPYASAQGQLCRSDQTPGHACCPVPRCREAAGK